MRNCLLPLFSCLLLLVSCKAESEFSTWACRFSYDNSVYLDAVLSSAMNSGSRGMFCQISETSRAGVLYLTFVSSNGEQSEKRQTAMEQQANYIMGLNNGIIVGFQTFVTEIEDPIYHGFVAYDVQCPNCVRSANNYVNPAFPVRMASTGIATCSKCGRRYDMNNGGIILNGEKDDTGLEKYVATTTGPLGFISVFRR